MCCERKFVRYYKFYSRIKLYTRNSDCDGFKKNILMRLFSCKFRLDMNFFRIFFFFA